MCVGSASSVKLNWVFAVENARLALNIGAEVQGFALYVTTEIISPHLTGATNAMETLQERLQRLTLAMCPGLKVKHRIRYDQ